LAAGNTPRGHAFYLVDAPPDGAYPARTMPELAEVEFYRRKWNAGIGVPVRCVHLNATKRIFKGVETAKMREALTAARLVSSAAHGKQMIFRFSSPAVLGVHLGMTGELRIENADYTPRKHDHLVLFQPDKALIFSDPRQFGRVRFHFGKTDPSWWSHLPPPVLSQKFTSKWMAAQLARHRALPLKAALLDQETFPGIGNWMADEILWQCRLHPRTKAGDLSPKILPAVWRTVRFVSRRAVETVARDTGMPEFGDPPKGFLFHARWSTDGRCPRDRTPLRRETIGGRTTAWCPKCQAPLPP
jgi:formamidopyrimidine-DNA glycosylase